MENLAINIKNASVFKDDDEILKNISFSVKMGSKCFILGANGAGKTTLVKLILGYIWAKWGASVEVLGQTFGKCDINKLREDIAWVSPYIIQNVKGNNGVDMVLSGKTGTLGFWRQASDNELDEARNVFEKYDAIHLANKDFDKMSSGEQVKILILRALYNKPKLMILDEPTAFLDISQREFLLKTVDEIAKSNPDLTILFISQNISDILPVFNYGFILKNGEMLYEGKREEIIREDVLKNTFGVDVEIIKTPNDRVYLIAK